MRPRGTWTPLMDEYLFKKRMAGDSFSAIAARMGVTRRSAQARFVRQFRHLAPPQVLRRIKKHGPETKAAIARMKQEGKKLREIAAELGLNVNQVHGIWWQMRQQLLTRGMAA